MQHQTRLEADRPACGRRKRKTMQIQLWPVSATSSLQSIWPECSLGRAFSGRPLASAAARGRKGQGAGGGGSGPGPARLPTATCPSQTGSCLGSGVLRGPGSGRRGAASRALPVEPVHPGVARTAPRAPHPRIRGRDPGSSRPEPGGASATVHGRRVSNAAGSSFGSDPRPSPAVRNPNAPNPGSAPCVGGKAGLGRARS